MVEWIMAIVQLCQSAVAAGKTLKVIKTSILTKREKELLRSAAEDGLFHVGCSDIDGKHVFTSRREFASADDPAETAHYLDAFIRLCDRGLIIHQDDTVFRLTGQGFELARELARP